MKSKYLIFCDLWHSLERATLKNDIDQINNLILKIEKILPFRNELEHNDFLIKTQCFNCWESYEEYVLNIAKRLN